MVKKVNKWLSIVVCVWSGIFLIDVVCVFVFHRPLFCLAIAGGEVMSYMGLGYRIDVFYPFGPIEEVTQSSSLNIHSWPFLGIVLVLILYLIISTWLNKKSKGK